MSRVLFIDDEIPIRETLSMYFNLKGIEVTSAATGTEARQLAEANIYDLVILDIHLGEEDGLALLDFFRQKDPKRPVIMFSSSGDDPEVIEQALAKGAAACMSKTDSLDNLLKAVQRAIQ